MKLAFQIATRFLKKSKGQTLLILLGITIGVAVQIFIGSLIDGLQVSLVDKTIGSSSHITIVPEDNEQHFNKDTSIYDALKEDERLTALSASLDGASFILQNEDSFPILIRGFDFEDANGIYKFQDNLVEGDLPTAPDEILLGRNLAEDLGVSLQDEVQVISPQGGTTEGIISGIYDLKVSNINSSWVPTTIQTAENFFDKEGEISQIESQIEDVFQADIIADEYRAQAQEDKLDIVDWKTQNEELLSALTGQSASSYMIQVFVLLAVLLGITSVLAISVVQKSRQIGILKAMGIKDRTSSMIFLFQGLILGIIGSILGAALGLALSYSFSIFVKNPDGTPLVPFYLDAFFIIASIAIAIIASTLASLIPARKSSKLNPMEVIKNG